MNRTRMKSNAMLMIVATAVAACDQGEICCHSDKVSSSAEASAVEVLPPVPVAPCDYPQTFGNASHTGTACTEQFGLTIVKTIVQDPDADAKADPDTGSGFLQQHESAPLTLGDFLIVPSTAGFVDIFDRSPERYFVQAYQWFPNVMAKNAQLRLAWTTRTSWQPTNGILASFGYVTNGYVSQFGPAIANGNVYIPERFGRINRVSLVTGASQALINPFAGTPFDGDERTIVNNALSVGSDGSVYYSVVAWPLGVPGPALRGVQPRGTWIVQIKPDNTFRLVDFQALAAAAGLPGAGSPCEYPFRTGGTPPATGPDSRAPIFGCGQQRPAMNSPIAIDETTGNLVIYSYANNAQGASFLTEVDPRTMTPVRFSDTRGHALHGCGERLSLDFVGGSGTSCRTITANGTTNIGFDPDFNGPVRFRGNDIMDNAPVVAPNGVRCIGSYDGGFTFGPAGTYDARSFQTCFDADGEIQAVNSEFGWEVTPSVWRNGAELTFLQDRNFYNELDLGVARYDLSFNLEFVHTIPLDLSPVAIDFVNAHLTFGPRGEVYAVNGDGHLYKFAPGIERPVEALTLPNDDGSPRSMATLSNYQARDRAGRVIVAVGGRVYVIEGRGLRGDEAEVVSSALAQRPDAAQRLARSLQAKAQAIADVTLPEPPK